MKNQEIWTFANSYFVKQLLLYAGISFVAVMVLVSFHKEVSWQPMAMMLLSLGVSVVKTEQEINKHFDQEGQLKK